MADSGGAGDGRTGFRFQPDTLSTLCQDYIAMNLTQTIAHDLPAHDLLELRNDIYLPAEAAEGIMSAYIAEGLPLTDKIIHLLRDSEKTKITSLDLSNSHITDWSLQWLSQHPIRMLDISSCNELSDQGGILKIIKKIQSSLRVLILGNKAELLVSDIMRCRSEESTEESASRSSHRQGLVHAAGDSNTAARSARSVGSSQPEGEGSDEEEESGYRANIPGESGSGYRPGGLQESDMDCEDGGVLDAPNLTVLSVNKISGLQSTDILSSLIRPLYNLQCLDMSHCSINLEQMDSLRTLSRLNSLTLHNVLKGFDLHKYLPILTSLTGLCVLDISVIKNIRPSTRYPPVSEQDEALQSLLAALPNLTSLDISGTHLAGIEKPETTDSDSVPIPGLAGRHFTFLGLFDCIGDPCSRRHLPADKITGSCNMKQIMESLRVYTKRGRLTYISEALSLLYTELKERATAQSINPGECLSLLCDVMRRGKDNLERQILASAAMYYILSSRVSFPDLHDYAPSRLIRNCVRCVYEAMDTHFGDKSMLKNGLLTLCHFSLPEDIMFMYKDMVVLLLLVIRHTDLHHNTDNFLQRISLHLFNNVVRSVDNVEKLLVGDQGAVKTMLWLIKNKIRDTDEADEILEMSWSALWNITDETEANCQKFLDGDGEQEGLDLFIACYNRFCDCEERSDKSEAVLRNMMGLLGNVSEVKKLRQRFLHPTYINLFSRLLESDSDGMEVSYHAAGIICHILYDGHDLSKWARCDSPPQASANQDTTTHTPANQNVTLTPGSSAGVPMQQSNQEATASANQIQVVAGFPMMDSMCSEDLMEASASQSIDLDHEMESSTKQKLLETLTATINRWDLQASRSINYRSFKPILKLLDCDHTIEVRHWAVWALSNLTTVYPEKYCVLLRDEAGLEILDNLVHNSHLQNDDIIRLINIIQSNCSQQFSSHYYYSE